MNIKPKAFSCFDDKESYKIYRTCDYDKFSFLTGNRSVEKQRIEKIRKSIEAVGLIPAPIICNEKGEIIDGQGRYMTCKEMKLPIYYMVIDGLGLDACVQMNISGTKWTKMDYINSYADRGNETYKFLQSLIEKYRLPVDVTIVTCTDRQCIKFNSTVENGEFYIDPKNYPEIVETLNYLAEFKNAISSLNGRKISMYFALIWIYRHSEADTDRVLSTFRNIKTVDKAIGDVYDALDIIEEVYNSRARKKYFMKLEYKKYMGSIASGYSVRYKEKIEKLNIAED